MQETVTLQQQSRRLSADLETPISLYLNVTQGNQQGLLLESAEVDGTWGRYSIIACDYLLAARCIEGKLKLDISDDRLKSLVAFEGLDFPEGIRQLMRHLNILPDDPMDILATKQ
jgi:anthranilate synthase component I